MRSPAPPVDYAQPSNSTYDASVKSRPPFAAPGTSIGRNVITVTDPTEIYEVVYSRRERELHVLIRRYVDQILYGCQNPLCTTKTCLSFQRRLAKGPFRRYTALSARALACHLVSEPNPEAGLCPNVPIVPLDIELSGGSSKTPRRTQKSNSTSGRDSQNGSLANGTASAGKPGHKEGLSIYVDASPEKGNGRNPETLNNNKTASAHVLQPSPSQSTPARAATKDHKSFTQNLFDTIALRMLEWVPLRPQTSRERGPVEDRPSPTQSKVVVKPFEAVVETDLVDTSRTSPTTGLDRDKRVGKIIEAAGTAINKPSLLRKSSSGINSVKNGQLSRRRSKSAAVPSLEPSSGGSPRRSGRKSSRERQPSAPERNAHIEPIHTSETKTGGAIDADKENVPPLDSHQVLSLGYLNEPLVWELQTLKARELSDQDGNLPDSEGPEQSTAMSSFIQQSLFYILKDPIRSLNSLTETGRGPHRATADHVTLMRFVNGINRLRPHNEIHRHIWMGLRQLQPQTGHVVQARSPGSGASSRRKSTSQPSSIYDDVTAAQYCLIALYALMTWSIPLTRFQDKSFYQTMAWRVVTLTRANGWALPWIDKNSNTDMEETEVNETLDLLERFDDEHSTRLAEELIAVISNRLALYEMSKTEKSKGKLFWSKVTRPRNIIQNLLAELAEFQKVQHQVYLYDGNLLSSNLLEHARASLLHHWDGKPIATRSSKVGSAIQVMAAMFEDKSNLGLSPSDFITPILSDRLDPIDMPVDWLSFRLNSKTIHFLSYSFLFAPDKVVSYFRAINFTTMAKSYEGAMAMWRHVSGIAADERIPIRNFDQVREALKPACNTYFVLQVRREDVLTDAINQIWRRQRRELLRPLKVRMGMHEGEEGVDHGGVQQEFFRVLFAEALNPDIGMFAIDPRTRMTWFQPGCPEPLYKYEVLGIFMSLAVYNSLTLPVTFPLAFYRKLLGLKVKKLDHIGDGWPELTRGLQDLLDWTEGDVGDIFVRTYEFTYEFAGQQNSIDMEVFGREKEWPPRDRSKSKGKSKRTSFDVSSSDQDLGRPRTRSGHTPIVGNGLSQSDPVTAAESPSLDPPADDNQEAALVTNENRERYVKDYIFWLTDKSIRPQYEAFVRGFYTCLDRTALSIFTPDALKSFVEGVQEIDIPALRDATKYEDGFNNDHPTIRDFWDIVGSFAVEQKRQLLEFVTASDRIPVNGVKSIMFVIQRNGVSDSRLPTSMTCFGRLLLPQYSTKAVLEEKLIKAVENSKGFGAP